MKGPDSFYTPMPLAERLVSYVTEKDVKNVVDFCVGDGDLLKAVRNKFTNIQLYGTDISKDAIDKIAKENVDWTLGVCDFRNDASIDKLSFLRDICFDLIMFNPPFTCKGGIVEHIEFEGESYKVSTAMMFVMRAIKYLSATGGMYAILPISCVYSQKDRRAWQCLQSRYNACILEEPDRVYFGNSCSPNIALVYIGHQKKEIIKKSVVTDFSRFFVNDIVRGCFRMQNISYSNSHKALRLIHTTNIQNGKLVKLRRVLPEGKQTVNGYGVVIPRVCNPNPGKVALLDGLYTYVLSDCIIVICTPTMEIAKQIRAHILENWPIFITLYKGTGARYTTIEKIKGLFNKK